MVLVIFLIVLDSLQSSLQNVHSVSTLDAHFSLMVFSFSQPCTICCIKNLVSTLFSVLHCYIKQTCARITGYKFNVIRYDMI